MKICITEYLRIDLARERWECRRCACDLGAARDNYKRGLLVHARDPREIHQPVVDPTRYAYTFAPDPTYCALLEYYCPACGTLVEVEYTVPGHPPVHDIELDVDDLKRKAATWASACGGALPPPESLHRPAPPRHVHGHGHGHD